MPQRQPFCLLPSGVRSSGGGRRGDGQHRAQAVAAREAAVHALPPAHLVFFQLRTLPLCAVLVLDARRLLLHMRHVLPLLLLHTALQRLHVQRVADRQHGACAGGSVAWAEAG